MSQSDEGLLIYGREKAEISGCFKNSSFVLRQCQNKVSFQRNASGVILKCSPHFSKDRKCFFMNEKHCQPSKIINKNSNLL